MSHSILYLLTNYKVVLLCYTPKPSGYNQQEIHMQAHLPDVSPPMVCDQDDFYRSERAPSRVIRARSGAEVHREQLLGQEVRRKAVQSVDTEHGIHRPSTAFSHHLCGKEIRFLEAV
jgi:hypothetical protein